MFDFFGQITGFIEAIYEYILGIVEGLAFMWSYLTGGLLTVPVITSYFPSVIGGALLAFFAVAVVKLIIGR